MARFSAALAVVPTLIFFAGQSLAQTDLGEVTTMALLGSPEKLDLITHRCATPAPSVASRLRSEAGLAQFVSTNPKFNERVGRITIPIRFHVIHQGETGKISADQIDEQIVVLNEAYKPHGIEFRKESVEWRDNKDWFAMEINTAEEREAKTELTKTPESSLNFYTANPSEALGWATFPWDMEGDPKMDGVVVLYGTLPGGSETGYDEGDTGVHEVGHWLGLLHTFDGWDPIFHPEGGCNSPGDEILDTPYEASPAFGDIDNCPAVTRDTCPNRNGKDPVKNYLDYPPDRCMDRFTLGQVTRMKQQVGTYREILIPQPEKARLGFVPLD